VLNNGVSGRGRFSHLLIAVGLALAAGGQASAQYSIEFLPSAVAGGDGFQAGFAVARGISGNGQVIVGSTNIYHQERAVVWRRENGAWTRSFLPMANAPDGRAAGRALTASWDGSTIVGATGGRFPDAGANPRFIGYTSQGVPAIWWQDETGSPALSLPIPLGTGVIGNATGVSSNGQAVAIQAVRTTGQAPLCRLARVVGGEVTYLSPDQGPSVGSYVVANLLSGSNMSSDGSVIVGMRETQTGPRAVRWTEAEGFVDVNPAASSLSSIGVVSGDGLVLGGAALPQVSTEPGPAMVWRDGVPQAFAGFSSILTGLASNGHYGVGTRGGSLNLFGDLADPDLFADGNRAFVLEGRTVLDLNQLLRANGVDFPSTTQLVFGNAITPDGQTIVGVAHDFTTNQSMSFIATIPTPGAAASMGLGMLMLGAWRRR
jgi:uncharacterized membrane protein